MRSSRTRNSAAKRADAVYSIDRSAARLRVARDPPARYLTTGEVTAQTTVFQSGNSQAVRLPKGFRVNSKTLQITRRGDEIILREKPLRLSEVLANLPALSKVEAAEFDQIMKTARDSLPPLEDRDLSWTRDVDSATPQTKPSAGKRRSHTRA
jgi:antitoxin VapB